MNALFNRLRIAAEAVLVVMMGIMFSAFIAQVVFRYIINLPLAWTEEVCTLVWLWGIFWAATFVMKNHEDIRFDMLYGLMPRPWRRGFTVLASSSIVLLLLASLPATWSYISFMKVEKSAAMSIPMHWIFSIYLVFVLAMCVRHGFIVYRALNNHLVEDDNNLFNLHADSQPVGSTPAPAHGSTK